MGLSTPSQERVTGPGPCDPSATVFRALRPKLGGRPLPAAGGQPRRCTGARPNPFLAVGSRNLVSELAWKNPPLSQRALSIVFRRAMREKPGTARCRGERLRPGREPRREARRDATRLLELRLG